MDQKRIERAAKKLRELFGTPEFGDSIAFDHFAKTILEAADTEEPEIVVTEAMKLAGMNACPFIAREGGTHETLDTTEIATIYRAMRPLEPIPPFTEKMKEAMGKAHREFDDDTQRGYWASIYTAARKLEGKS